MSDATVTGTVHLIEPTQTFGSKGFRKRLVVLQQEFGSFTNYVPIEMTREACDEADVLNVGDTVTVAYRPNGRKWQKDESSEVRYFVNLESVRFTVDAKAVADTNEPDDTPF